MGKRVHKLILIKSLTSIIIIYHVGSKHQPPGHRVVPGYHRGPQLGAWKSVCDVESSARESLQPLLPVIDSNDYGQQSAHFYIQLRGIPNQLDQQCHRDSSPLRPDSLGVSMDIHQPVHGQHGQDPGTRTSGHHSFDWPHPPISQISPYCVVHSPAHWQSCGRVVPGNQTGLPQIINLRPVLPQLC